MTRYPPGPRRRTTWTLGLTLVTGLTASEPACAQAATDLFLVQFAGGETPEATVTRITDRDGYDNQPSFTPDGRFVFFTSIRGDQADVYRYDVSTGETTQLVSTRESEYSPTVMPGGLRFCVVRVEADSTQRLWSFALDGSDPQLLLPEIAPVGYHAWLNETRVALFVLGSPATLQLADLTTGEARIVAEDIGRSIHRVPDGEMVSFLWRVAEGEAWITAYDPGTGALERLVQPVGANEFHTWLPDGSLVMGEGSMLYVAHPGSWEWREVVDLTDHGLRSISRIAVAQDGMTLVVVGGR